MAVGKGAIQITDSFQINTRAFRHIGSAGKKNRCRPNNPPTRYYWRAYCSVLKKHLLFRSCYHAGDGGADIPGRKSRQIQLIGKFL